MHCILSGLASQCKITFPCWESVVFFVPWYIITGIHGEEAIEEAE
jgi:hypothetical protein